MTGLTSARYPTQARAVSWPQKTNHFRPSGELFLANNTESIAFTTGKRLPKQKFVQTYNQNEHKALGSGE